jgi:hypothetical protein
MAAQVSMVLVVVVMLALLAGQQAGGSGRAGVQEAGRKASSWTVVGNHSGPAGVASNNSFLPYVRALLLQVQDAQRTRAYDNTIADVNNNTLASETIKLPKDINTASCLVQAAKQWSRAYDNTCAAVVLPTGHQDLHALAPGTVALPLDLTFPEDISSASFMAHATTCHASLLEDACPDQQHALAALWAHLATCPGPVQVTIEESKPQGHQCPANRTTVALDSTLDAKNQAVRPAAYFLGVNTTNTAYTVSTPKMVDTRAMWAAACCTLAGLLASALRHYMSKPSAPKPKWYTGQLEVLRAFSEGLSGNPDQDAYWVRWHGTDGAELLEAIKAAGLYPEPPIKPSPPSRVAPKQSTTTSSSPPTLPKPRHQSTPPSSRALTTATPPSPSPGKPKQQQVPVPISEPPAPHSAFTFTRLAPSSPTLPIFGRPTSKAPQEFSFHRHHPALTGSPTLPIFGKTF